MVTLRRLPATFLVAALALSGCTLLFPLGDHELLVGDGGGGGDALADAPVAETGASDAGVDDAAIRFDPAETVATLPVGATYLALAPGLAYVGAPEGLVLRVNVTTGAVETLNNKADPSQPVTVTGLESDAISLYVGMGQTNIGCGNAAYVYRRDHGDGGFTSLLTRCGLTSAIAIDLADVSAAISSGDIVLLPKPGGSLPLASGLAEPSALASTNEDLFVGSASGKSIVRVPKSADAGSPFAPSAGIVRDVVADEARVYWLAGDGTVYAKARTADAAQAPTVLATGQTAPLHLAADATRLFWTASGDGVVRSVAKAGGDVVTVADHENDPFDVAVDANHVYWTARAGGALRRAAKH